jgi:flagellar motor switch protein FliN/FliY
MSDGSLSQEEIDALLQGADDLGGALEAEAPGGSFAAAPTSADALTDDEINELRTLASEIGRTMGTTLSTITGKTAKLSNPTVEVSSKDAYILQITEKPVQITADYSGELSGRHSYVITETAAKQIAALMMAQEEEEGELTEMALSAITEGFSQMSGAASGVIEENIGKQVRAEGLKAELRDDPIDLDLPEENFVRIHFDFMSNGNSSFIDEILDMGVAKSIADEMMKKKGMFVAQSPGTPSQGEPVFQPGMGQAVPQFSFGPEPKAGLGNVGVQSVQFPSLSPTAPQGMSGNIGLLMDVSMQLTVELGRTKMLIKDILGMGEGTIVELDKLAGEPVDLLVNGKLIAKGEVVVIDENFGVRVTDIISPMERISNLE